MSKRTLVRILLSVICAGYLVVALAVSHNLADRVQGKGFLVKVNTRPGAREFVTAADISRLLAEWKVDRPGQAASAVDLQGLEDRLNKIDNIEHANVSRMSDDRILVEVTPMIPVVRVFDRQGSYYLNRSGKRLSASARFRLDVPVITGEFSPEHPASELLGLVERIHGDSTWNAIVAQINVDPRSRDIILAPMIRGHVINIGDTTDIRDKLRRVMLMYRKVLPVKGWAYYDTISVKWRGQVVATRREKSIPEPLVRFDQEGDEVEFENIDNMLLSADTVATPPRPAQTETKP